MASSDVNNKVMNFPDGDFDLMDLERSQREAVCTLIIGPTPGSPDDKDQTITLNTRQLESLKEIEEYLPNLSSLHIWGIANLESIGELPGNLKVLDIRSCPEFRDLDKIGKNLEMLFIEDAPEFSSCRLSKKFNKLWDISLQGTGITSEFLSELLSKTPALQRIHLNRCAKLEDIQDWHLPKDQLEDIRLSECPELAILPDVWPALRRLDLRNSPKAKAGFRRRKLPHKKLQYLDLTGAKQIDSFPIDESCFSGTNKLQTLYLYRSGIQEPPKSLHGSKDDQNVLEDIAGYYQDARIVGTEKIDRSKILMLGNGGVGKTCLSLALHPKHLCPDPAKKAEELDTTHAIQFFSLKRETNDPDFPNLNLGIWDFGGQEIYHGTHRLFIQTGAVFCILWHPEINCREKDTNNPDENRPLQYWLDYIRMARSNGRVPKIAIVVPRSLNRDEAVIRKIQSEAGEENRSLIAKDNIKIFFIESGTRGGEFERFNEWLESSVVETLKTEGAKYPSYWALAESMVTDWQENPPANIISIEQFQEYFENYIKTQLKSNRDNYPELYEAWNDPKTPFRLDENRRIERTLSFLTDIGLLYWRPGLLQTDETGSQVIIGQKWALDAIYAILDHRESASEWQKFITSNGGMFSLDELDEKGWKPNEKIHTEAEKERILSLMVECDICFRIVDKKDSWFEKDIYACFSWLPEFRKRHQWLNDVDGQDGKLEADPDLQNVHMLRHHWYSFLAAAGRQYGRNAEYAKDAFKLTLLEGDKKKGEPRRGPSILIHFKLDSASGIKGSFDIYVTGKKAGHEGVDRAKNVLKYFLPIQPKAKKEPEEQPDSAEVKTAQVSGHDGPGPDAAPRKTTVFISYSWGKDESEEEKENLYKRPAQLLYDHLNGIYDVFLDIHKTRKGDEILHNINTATKRDKAVLLLSEKYFLSAYCIYELIQIFKGVINTRQSFTDRILPVNLFSNEDLINGADKTEKIEFVLDQLHIREKLPDSMEEVSIKWLKRRGYSTLDFFFSQVNTNITNVPLWNHENHEESLKEIQELLSKSIE